MCWLYIIIVSLFCVLAVFIYLAISSIFKLICIYIYFIFWFWTWVMNVFDLGYVIIFLYMCDRVHRYTRWIGRLSHQSSDLSCLCNLQWKVEIHAMFNTGFKGMQLVTYLTNCQTTEVRLTKSSPQRVWVHAHEKKRYTVLPGYTLAPWEALIYPE